MSKYNWFLSGIVFGCIFSLIVLTIFQADFSSPSGPGQSQTIYPNDSDGPALISTLDLQRELNRRDPKLKLVEDGVYGNATRAAHEQALGNQYAVELWPEKVRIVE